MAPQSRTRATAAASFLVLLALCVAPAHGGRALPAASKGAVSKAQAAANATAGDEFLAPHNKARAAVSVAPLRWSADLATAAATTTSQQQLNKNCAFADMAASPYGANQGWASYRARPAEVVASWVDQGRYYTHANNSCVAGKQCGTYTQVVWRRTAQLGCAQASCASGATLTLCLYDPHGNVQGQSPY
ncbi:STS14 protein-like [Lolium rigidum]|uniref:STS14 protein-like n=1 Tax=Lolium rigidum TaxID=89674 RepID=UPI001F5C5561|nr:STS14 protein-like [Lolium rigidum]